MKTEVLKKNIFWILAGVAPFLTFLTFLFVFLFVGGEVATKSEAITKDLTDLGSKKAKGVKGLGTMDKQKDVIAQQKQKLWEANWDQQLKLFTWPTSSNGDLKAFEQKYQKFGEKIQGVLNGFDRLVFRGSLRKICYPFGMLGYLWANQVKLKDFGAHVNAVGEQVKEAALKCVKDAGLEIAGIL